MVKEWKCLDRRKKQQKSVLTFLSSRGDLSGSFFEIQIASGCFCLSQRFAFGIISNYRVAERFSSLGRQDVYSPNITLRLIRVRRLPAASSVRFRQTSSSSARSPVQHTHKQHFEIVNKDFVHCSDLHQPNGVFTTWQLSIVPQKDQNKRHPWSKTQRRFYFPVA